MISFLFLLLAFSNHFITFSFCIATFSSLLVLLLVLSLSFCNIKVCLMKNVKSIWYVFRVKDIKPNKNMKIFNLWRSFCFLFQLIPEWTQSYGSVCPHLHIRTSLTGESRTFNCLDVLFWKLNSVSLTFCFLMYFTDPDPVQTQNTTAGFKVTNTTNEIFIVLFFYPIHLQLTASQSSRSLRSPAHLLQSSIGGLCLRCPLCPAGALWILYPLSFLHEV